MSDQLNNLKNQNPIQNTTENQNFRQGQDSDYGHKSDIQDTAPLEILQPRRNFDLLDIDRSAELENPELNPSNQYFDETNPGYGQANFGEQQEEYNLEKSTETPTFPQTQRFPQSQQAPIFSQTHKTYDEANQTFVAPVFTNHNQFEPDLESDNSQSKTQIKTNLVGDLWAPIQSLITFENLIFFVVCLVAFRVRLSFFPFISGDYGTFLKPWMEKIEAGGFAAFKEAFYNYTPLYVYVLGLGVALKANFLVWVKIVSVFFDYVLCYYVAKVVSIKHPNAFKLAFMTALVIPATIFNGSMWGQCDSIYGSFVIGSLYYLLKTKYFKSAFMFALSLCLKLQGVFFAPVFLILLITKNLPKKFILTVPALFVALYLLMILPISQNFILGPDARPLFDTTSEIQNGVVVPVSKNDGLLTIYTGQSKAYSNLVMGAVPNMYQWIDNDKYQYFYQAGLGFAIIGLLLVAYYFVYNKIENVDNDIIIKISLLSVLLMPYLLPKMHERYFFLADIMAIVYSFWFPKKFWVGIIVSLVSLSVYVSGVIGGNLPQFLTREFTALWIFGIIVFVFYDLVKGLKQDKAKKELLES